MAFKLTAPIEKTFYLEETDKEYPPDDPKAEKTSVTIKQAAQYEHERRMDLFADFRTIMGFDDEGNQTYTAVEKRNIVRIRRKDAFLTMTGCNIKIEKDGKEELLFKFKDGKLAMSEDEFEQAWGMLPSLPCREIHRFVLELNPDWSLRGEVL